MVQWVMQNAECDTLKKASSLYRKLRELGQSEVVREKWREIELIQTRRRDES